MSQIDKGVTFKDIIGFTEPLVTQPAKRQRERKLSRPHAGQKLSSYPSQEMNRTASNETWAKWVVMPLNVPEKDTQVNGFWDYFFLLVGAGTNP